MVTIRKIDNFGELSAMSQVWDAILKQSYADHVFLTWPWINWWWTVFGPQHRLYVLVAETAGKLVGIAPLMQTERNGDVWLKFIGTPDADYTDFILPPDRVDLIANFFDYINDHRQDWVSIRLTQVPSSSPTVAALKSLLPVSNPRYLIETTDNCPAFVYDSSEDLNRSQFTIKKARSVRKNINRFEKEGDLELKLFRGRYALAEHVPALINYHIRRWHATDTPSRFLLPDHRRFCADLANQPGLTERVVVFALMFKKLPIAYLLCFDYGGKIGLYTLTHSAFYNKRSPGQILHYYLIEHAVREGYDCIDFMRGGEQYKQRYTNKSESNVRIEIFSRALDYIRLRLRKKLKTFSLAQTIHRFLKHRKDGGKDKALRISRKDFYRCTQINPVPAAIDGFFKKIISDDIERICSFLGLEAASEGHRIMVERFETGTDCFVFERQGNIAALVWAEETEHGSPQSLLLGFEASEAIGGRIYNANLIAEVTGLHFDQGKQITALVGDDEQEFLQALKTVGFEKTDGSLVEHYSRNGLT